MFKRIDHVALHVADLDRAITFYEDNFGFRKYFQHQSNAGMQIAYLRLGDTVLELTHKSDGSMTGFHFCLETDDLDLEKSVKFYEEGVSMYRHCTQQLQRAEKRIDILQADNDGTLTPEPFVVQEENGASNGQEEIPF